MGPPGCLSPENRRRLSACGTQVRDTREAEGGREEPRDIVTNYHVEQVLALRQALLETVQEPPRTGKTRKRNKTESK